VSLSSGEGCVGAERRRERARARQRASQAGVLSQEGDAWLRCINTTMVAGVSIHPEYKLSVQILTPRSVDSLPITHTAVSRPAFAPCWSVCVCAQAGGYALSSLSPLCFDVLAFVMPRPKMSQVGMAAPFPTHCTFGKRLRHCVANKTIC